MSNNFKCPICGKPTSNFYGKYREDGLCKKHKDMLINGLIYQCEDCGKWNDKNTTCECSTQEVETKKENNLTCIICDEHSNGKHFCIKCWNKYKDKAIDVRITNCKEVEIIDAYGNLQYKCDDGRKVRSKSEKIISDFLFKYGIRTIYEKTVYYYPNENEVITLHPDFYLPDYNYYIEHNGIDSKTYKANKKKTEEMYKSLNYKVIVTTENDLSDIEAKLKPILKIN